MEIQTKFVSQDNKRILWEIMVENNLFNGIPNKYANKIKAEFEVYLEQISQTIIPNDNILNLNKQIILQMMEEVKKYASAPITSAPITSAPITSAEVLTKKQEQFQKGLQTKQEEFTRLIQPVKPQSIDFTDKIDDEPIGSEMDIKLSQTIAWREKQLSQVLEKQNPVEASEWINNGKKVNTSVNTSVNANVSNHIKIGNSTKIDESNIINLKKVSFGDVNEINLNEINLNEINVNEINVNEISLNEINVNEISLDVNKKQTPIPFNFMDKLKKKDGLGEFKNELNVDMKADIEIIKTDLEWVKMNMNKLLLDNKLILENQEKILDKIEQIAFQVGSI